ncbi:16S rRNA (cytidine(1402)-2'-O)-methyltransferase [Catenovulum maritimum]|uniref:Ribosomal RNA small subunit methyltransferase I n=1 Tax=Catenovulum maritimum TaxID=1513271 RepID=A0A0J8JJG1_9ALTE|nr:16S rRNA (cytidine(1402)-2'-O)-methyltransferase [Catenovulum maritimum]KMT64561.1 tetrapyrrole methylase [Catenovulum maritimum]
MSQLGELFVVATPIGNLEDMSQRALSVLNNVDLIAAEDTRHAGKLLSHFSVTTKCIAYHDHNEDGQSQRLIEQLLAGVSIALISDAGTPLINDPGYKLVRRCRENNIRVIPVPGACAVITALCAAGVATDEFYFGGFLPAKSNARQATLAKLKDVSFTAVYYESTHRILACLADLEKALGADKQIVICRELTKTFETIHSASVSECLEWIKADHNQQKGEFVLVIEADKSDNEIDEKCVELLKKLTPHMPLKTAAGIVADTYGVKKKAIYEIGISL